MIAQRPQTTEDTAHLTGWRAALLWGVGAALLHRLLLGVWLALVWGVMSPYFPTRADFHATPGKLPELSAAEQPIFGVWRRWDAIHYLDLALYGYQADNPGPTVFAPLTPLGIRAFDALLPGPPDLGALVFETLAFALALTLLYRLCEVYYGDPGLGRWAVAVMTLLPLSYFFAAPLSEAPYLALVLGLFYCATRGRWGLAALCGLLATLTRSQGAALLAVGGLIALEKMLPASPSSLPKDEKGVGATGWGSPTGTVSLQTLIPAFFRAARQAWPLAVLPLSFFGFEAWRASLGLPPMSDIYLDYSYIYFVNPLEGLFLNLRYMVENPAKAVTYPDLIALWLVLLLSVVALRFPKHRRLPLLAYTFGYLALFVSKMNYVWGTTEVYHTQSFGRYALMLFPLAVLLADGLRHTTFWGRIVGVGALLLGLMWLSAGFALALSGP